MTLNRTILTGLSLAAISTSAYADNIILQPPQAKDESALLVLVPGAGIANDRYVEFAKALQRDSYFSLWVAIPDFLGDFPNPLQMAGKVDSVVESVRRQGFSQAGKKNFYISGHSLGGVMAQGYAEKNKDVDGLLLYASYLAQPRLPGFQKYSLATFKKPVLTIAGDRDALTRLPWVARSLQQLDKRTDTTNLKPVAVVEGANHMQFVDGIDTGRGKRYIKADIPLEEAWAKIARLTSAFMGAVSGAKGSVENQDTLYLKEATDNAKDILSPFLAREVNLSPCQRLQSKITQPLNSESQIEITEKLYQNGFSFVGSKPSLQVSDGVVTAHTKRIDKTEGNRLDRSNVTYYAEEVACKTKSRAAIAKAVGIQVEDTKAVSCKEINREVFATAYGLLSDKQKQRYEETGRTIRFQPDEEFSTGLQWASSGLDHREEEPGLAVKSPALFTQTTANPRFAGMNYCKVVNVGQALEWYLINSHFED